MRSSPLKIRQIILMSSLSLSVFTLTGCGNISSIVDLNFGNESAVDNRKSTSQFELVSSSGKRTSGSFSLEASIGHPMSSAIKTSGAFKFQGSIQGQIPQ